jgi:Ca2+-binding EF-hand superfamily protein
MMGVALAMLVVVASASEQESALSAHAPGDETRVFIFLAETRPVFVRLRVTSQGRTPEASWLESMRTLWASLDRNGDGVVTIVEADPNFLVAFMRLPLPVSRPLGPVYLDQEPKDGKISIEELAEGLRSILPPIRLDFGRQSIGRTDALFDQLDRNKDEELTRPELAAIAGSLRPLDLDDNEMISALELEPFGVLATRGEVSESTGRSAGATTITPVVELTAGESTYRPARLMLKKFDRGKGGGASRPDGKLSPTEFAIALDAFAAADRNSDDALTVEELRRLIDHPPIDVNLDVTFAADGRGRVKAVLAPVATGDKQALLRQIGDGELEIALGSVRLDIHVENGNASTLEARRILEQQSKRRTPARTATWKGRSWIRSMRHNHPWPA